MGQLGNNFIITAIANFIGVPYDQILLVIAIGSAIPLGLINHKIKNPQMRLWYGFISGFFLQYTLYGSGIVHTFIASLFTYFFIQNFGRKYSPFWVLFFTFAHLTSMHLYRMIVKYGEWSADDPTSIYMMSICKYSSMAFSYEDGGKDDKDLKNSHWRQYKVKEKPTLLETLSFAFFYPSSVIGPSFEFKDFYNFIYFKDCYAHIPTTLTMLYGGYYLLFSILMMGFYGGFGPRYPLAYVGTVEYGTKSLLYRFMYLNFAMALHRAKFYSGWLLSYTGFIFSGIAYTETPRDKNEPTVLTEINGPMIKSFSKGKYGSITDCEFGINPKTKIISWNNTVHLWLKYNLFLRMINIDHPLFKNNFTLASLMTFMISAFWHGFYPTYYIFFFLFFIYQTANEKFDKMGFYTWCRTGNFLKRIPVGIFSQFMVNALGAIIFNLKWKLFIQFMKNVYCSPIIIVFSLYGFSKIVKNPKKEVEKKKV